MGFALAQPHNENPSEPVWSDEKRPTFEFDHESSAERKAKREPVGLLAS